MLDLAVLIILAVFFIGGLASGMLYQVLRIAAVFASVLVAMYATGPLIDAFPFLAGLPLGGETIVPVTLFFLAFMILTFLSSMVSKALNSFSIAHGFWDRLFGAIFGVLKGVILCYFIISIFLAAEAVKGQRLSLIDTRESKAADVVRDWPLGRLADVLEELVD